MHNSDQRLGTVAGDCTWRVQQPRERSTGRTWRQPGTEVNSRKRGRRDTSENVGEKEEWRMNGRGASVWRDCGTRLRERQRGREWGLHQVKCEEPSERVVGLYHVEGWRTGRTETGNGGAGMCHGWEETRNVGWGWAGCSDEVRENRSDVGCKC